MEHKHKLNRLSSWLIICLYLTKSYHCIPFESKTMMFTKYTNNIQNTNKDDNSLNDQENVDASVYGNTDESFFDFANRRVSEMNAVNEQLFDKSINSCPYTPLDHDLKRAEHHEAYSHDNTNRKCLSGSLLLSNLRGKTADRIFLVDDLTLGVISSADSSVSFFSIQMPEMSVVPLRTKVFRNQVPFDACADSMRNVFVVFPEQNKISKFSINQTTLNFKTLSIENNFKNKTNFILREIYSIRDADFKPSSISCNDDLVYVSERAKNQIRVYDTLLRLVRIINLNGVIVSTHSALSVDQNVRVFADGLDGVALFNPRNNNKIANRKKTNTMSEISRVNICHFYKNMNCIEDIDVYTEEKFKSSIYIVDSCDNDVKQFFYSREEKIQLANRFRINYGKPISAVRNSFGYLVVLTNSPTKIDILDIKECS